MFLKSSGCYAQQTGVHRMIGSTCLIVYSISERQLENRSMRAGIIEGGRWIEIF
jgi:hypothetical protein